MPSHPIPSTLITSHSVSSHPISSHPTSSHPTSSHPTSQVVGAIRTVASFSAEHRFLDAYAAHVEAARRRVMSRRLLIGALLMGFGTAGMFIMVG
jgi:hypothetical protein